MTSDIINKKILLRKAIAKAEQALKKEQSDRLGLLEIIRSNRLGLRVLAYAEMGLELPGAPEQKLLPENIPERMPNLGQLRAVLEKELQKEQQHFDNDTHQSDNDVKRLALKEVVLDYYNELPNDYETPVVDYEGDMTLRRDNQETDETDFDFAPNKNNIYSRWMDKLQRYIKDGKMSPAEYDEASERGTPQGGAFEKQLDRYRKDFVKQIWQNYYQQKEV